MTAVESKLALFISEDTRALIKAHEGYRGEVYADTAGVLTVGWGHALHLGSKVPEEAAQAFFQMDYMGAVDDYFRLRYMEDVPPLDEARAAAMVDMLFNLGLPGVRRFKRMLAAWREKDWEKMADEMLNSRWAQQVRRRAIRLSDMIRYGEWPDTKERTA